MNTLHYDYDDMYLDYALHRPEWYYITAEEWQKRIKRKGLERKDDKTMRNNVIIREAETFRNKLEMRAFELIKSKVKDKFGISMSFDQASWNKLIVASLFIKEYDSNYEKHVAKNGAQNTISTNQEFIVPLRKDTFLYVGTGKYSLEYSDQQPKEYSNNMYLYFFGKKAYAYYNKLKRELDKQSQGLLKYNVSGSKDSEREEFNSIESKLAPRDIDTLFFEDHVKKSIIGHIDSFLENEQLYKDRSIMYKTGILLYGDPGTGKTSLANAIASYYKCNLIIIDMSTFNSLSISRLTAAINADDERYIVLLEDIDTMFASLDRTSSTIDKDEKKAVNRLLQFLDSNTSPTNVIFVATTNHIEVLDEAIKRKGRFDKQIEVRGIGKQKAKEMCESFNLSETETQGILGESKFPINQSYLQGMILDVIEHRNSKEE